MPRKAQPRKVLPSGIQQSANGKYYYWKCIVSGLETFADEKRFKDIISKYGSEEKLVKTYVLRPAKKYVEAGFSPESIKEIAENNGGKLPDLDAASKARKAELHKKERKKGVKQFAVATEEIKNENTGEVEPIKVYPWTGNPDFFKSPPAPISVGEVTRETCLYPNRHLDNDCHGCSIYKECACAAKFSEEDWKKPRKRDEVKITPIKSFDA